MKYIMIYELRWIPIFCHEWGDSAIEPVNPEGTFCDTVHVPSGDGDMELI